MAATTTTYRMWKRLAERPGGSGLFSVAAMARVQYSAVEIVPHVVRMEPGYAEVTVPKWFFVKSVETPHQSSPCAMGCHGQYARAAYRVKIMVS